MTVVHFNKLNIIIIILILILCNTDQLNTVATLARLSFIIIIVQAGICILGLLWLKTMYMKFGKLLECNINFELYSKY